VYDSRYALLIPGQMSSLERTLTRLHCEVFYLKNTSLHVRLQSLEFLDKPDWRALGKLFENEEHAHAGAQIVHEKETMNRTRFLVKGWAYRYKLLPDGRRQILNFLLPGDIIGFYAVMRNQSDYGVDALTPVELAAFPAAELINIVAGTPRLILALSWIAAQSERLLDEQITRIGRRNAAVRMAHLFVELFLRLRNAGILQERARILPLSQSVLADALGMSHVHANRSFKLLARDGAVSIRNAQIHLDNIEALASRADFDTNYLKQISVPEITREAMEEKKPFFSL
jgi:CRP-like cAMP-binding protein